MIIDSNKTWVFGDEIDTDLLAPGQYMKGPIEEMAKHCLEGLDPSFASTVQEGDVVVAGEFFGMGSSREQAPEALLLLGVRAVIAKSFGRIFYRNALNLGLPAVTCGDVDRIQPGDALHIDVAAGRIENRTRNETYDCQRIPPELLEMIEAGGLIPHLEQRLKAKRS